MIPSLVTYALGILTGVLGLLRFIEWGQGKRRGWTI